MTPSGQPAAPGHGSASGDPAAPAAGRPAGLARALAEQEERLMGCVHCGFCLPACPTYVRLGDEADSPRGRLYLMRAVAEGRLDPGADAFQEHIDRCLGCRACETVCPSGVEYGFLLERARQVATEARRPSPFVRLLLRVFRTPALLKPVLAGARTIRAGGIAGAAVRLLPPRAGRARMAAGMLDATRPTDLRRMGTGVPRDAADGAGAEARPSPDATTAEPGPSGAGRQAPPVALLDGCVQAGLFGHVNAATARVLAANGHRIVPVPRQVCCGALHAHAGALDEARALARANIEAFGASGAAHVVVNAAGCGAAMKEYDELLAGDSEWHDRARDFSARVVDVSEVLDTPDRVVGAPLSLRVAYDAPCHLLHGQGVEHAPLRLLGSIPGLEAVPLAGSSECCGGAGIYGITHPDLGGRIGGDKSTAVAEAGADLVATGNPGCIMQIGAATRTAGASLPVVHPVELVDESYRRAGFYDRG